jgi:hypothetical protein
MRGAMIGARETSHSSVGLCRQISPGETIMILSEQTRYKSMQQRAVHEKL